MDGSSCSLFLLFLLRYILIICFYTFDSNFCPGSEDHITNNPAETQKSETPAQSSPQDNNSNQNNSKTAEEQNTPSKSSSSGDQYHHNDVRVVEKQGVTATAVLPLTIGLFLTLFLLLMMSCRLRYMNQRLRYGRLKTNNAHDADYLINGMYL